MTDLPLDRAEIRSILEARARILARSPEPEPAGPMVDLLVLSLGQERYGVALHHVEEIQPLRGLAPVPGTPRCWSGVVNLRGRLHPVLDLSAYLGLREPRSNPANAQIVVASGAGLTVALLVDEVAEVIRIRHDEIGPATADGREIIRGITPSLVTVIDLEAVFNDPKLVVHGE